MADHIWIEWEAGEIVRVDGTAIEDMSRDKLAEVFRDMGRRMWKTSDQNDRISTALASGIEAVKEYHRDSLLAGLNEALDIISQDKEIPDPMDPGSTLAVDAHDIHSAQAAIRRAIAEASKTEGPARYLGGGLQAPAITEGTVRKGGVNKNPGERFIQRPAPPRGSHVQWGAIRLLEQEVIQCADTIEQARRYDMDPATIERHLKDLDRATRRLKEMRDGVR